MKTLLMRLFRDSLGCVSTPTLTKETPATNTLLQQLLVTRNTYFTDFKVLNFDRLLNTT